MNKILIFMARASLLKRWFTNRLARPFLQFCHPLLVREHDMEGRDEAENDGKEAGC
jgi:hypothetical protein